MCTVSFHMHYAHNHNNAVPLCAYLIRAAVFIHHVLPLCLHVFFKPLLSPCQPVLRARVQSVQFDFFLLFARQLRVEVHLRHSLPHVVAQAVDLGLQRGAFGEADVFLFLQVGAMGVVNFSFKFGQLWVVVDDRRHVRSKYLGNTRDQGEKYIDKWLLQ
jgi:hypothetical protein